MRLVLFVTTAMLALQVTAMFGRRRDGRMPPWEWVTWKDFCRLTLKKGDEIQSQSKWVAKPGPIGILIQPGVYESFKTDKDCNPKIRRGKLPDGYTLHGQLKYITPDLASMYNRVLDDTKWWPFDSQEAPQTSTTVEKSL